MVARKASGGDQDTQGEDWTGVGAVFGDCADVTIECIHLYNVSTSNASRSSVYSCTFILNDFPVLSTTGHCPESVMVVAIFGIISTESLWNGIASPSASQSGRNESVLVYQQIGATYRVTGDRRLPMAPARTPRLHKSTSSIRSSQAARQSLTLVVVHLYQERGLASEQSSLKANNLRCPYKKVCPLAHHRYFPKLVYEKSECRHICQIDQDRLSETFNKSRTFD